MTHETEQLVLYAVIRLLSLNIVAFCRNLGPAAGPETLDDAEKALAWIAEEIPKLDKAAGFEPPVKLRHVLERLVALYYADGRS